MSSGLQDQVMLSWSCGLQ